MAIAVNDGVQAGLLGYGEIAPNACPSHLPLPCRQTAGLRRPCTADEA
jgi:hypothetical protein